jgi:hypothetical protein
MSVMSSGCEKARKRSSIALSRFRATRRSFPPTCWIGGHRGGTRTNADALTSSQPQPDRRSQERVPSDVGQAPGETKADGRGDGVQAV